MLDVVILGLGDDAVPYREAWEKQREIHKQVVSGERPNTLLLLEHQSVYTAGKRTEDSERPMDGTEVIDVDRGGKITWHGPGQLVGYPITKLQEPMDVVAYVRTIEGLLIDTAAEFGVTGERVDGRFAINCNNSLQAYENIVACGIRDAGATTLSQISGTNITPSDVVPVVTRLFTHYFEDAHVS